MRKAGLDTPQTAKLFEALGKEYGGIPEGVLSVDEAFEFLKNKIRTALPSGGVKPRMSIKLTDVTHTYMPGTPFEKVALKNVSLEIKDGEFAAIIGHTGCGKSTLVQHFNGLLMPDVGAVSMDGVLIAKKNLSEIRKKIGFVFQYPEHQLFEETVYKDIAFGLKRLKLSDDEERELIYGAAEKVGLDKSLMERSV